MGDVPVYDGQHPLRVVVQDQRRLVREGLASVLATEPDIVVVATVEKAYELGGIVNQADAAVCADAFDVPDGFPGRVVRLLDEPPAALLVRLRSSSDASAPFAIRLTPRESEVMRGVANGLSTGRVGALLGISQKTVENHKQRVFAKLGVQSQAHAVAMLHATGYSEASGRSA